MCEMHAATTGSRVCERNEQFSYMPEAGIYSREVFTVMFHTRVHNIEKKNGSVYGMNLCLFYPSSTRQ